MLNYPLTTSMQFLINTFQPITEEEKEAIREQIKWKKKYVWEDGKYPADYVHNITFGYHTEEDHSNRNYIWITVQLSPHDKITHLDTVQDLNQLMMDKAYTMLLSVLNPMRENDELA